ncbi:lysophospholipase L1-like esterase [Amnibacterium kyonggiense]|uniref:Lysophospholipase L1-like esterase n=1 Tax=Amnibacterium kyonggiense TaxID=595671 RepID=A0A4R7FTG4_9MICO|nr:lysophospholipase L1-like esterase [Amnibacterium kyonggiense]
MVNHAYGGATALDLVPQLRQISVHPGDVLVISITTNDLAHWKQVPLDRFREAVTEVLRLTSHHRTIFLLPPPLDPARQHAARPAQVRSPEDQLRYLTELIARIRDSSADTIALPADDIHDTDGVHLNDYGYDLLIAALARRLAKR